MSAENVALVKRSLETLVETGEIDWTTVDEDIEIIDHDIPDQAGYRGHAGLAQWLEDWGSAWADYTIEPKDFIDAGNHVVVVIRMRATGRGSGVELDREDAIVYELHAGKIVRSDYYNDKHQAFTALGIPPSGA
jgi:ketosteroid isomerase-like protein